MPQPIMAAAPAINGMPKTITVEIALIVFAAVIILPDFPVCVLVGSFSDITLFTPQ